jgi:large repetitive protein
MSRPSPARRARSYRKFRPSVPLLEPRLLLSADLEGDSLATALGVSLTRGALYSHQATIGDGNYPTADVDLYAISMTAGQHLLVAAEARALDEGGSLSNLDNYARIFDATGNQLASSDDSNNPFTGVFSADSSLSYVAASTATYYVGVSAYGNSTYNPNTAGTGTAGGTTGAYRLELLLSNSAPLAAPTGFSATASGSSQINLSWSAVAAATGYTLQRSANGSTGWATDATVGSSTTTYSDTGLSAGTTYYYRVQASDADSISAYSAQASATTIPPAPTGLSATAVSATQINLSWTNQASNIYYTYVAQSTDNVNWAQLTTIYSPATSYTATGPFNGSTTYYYRVWTYSSPGGNSLYSPVASVTTPAYPNPPTFNSATPQSDTSVALSWTTATGATGYLAQRSTNGGSTWVTAGTTAAGVTTFTDTGLSEATSYSYRVLGTNSVGNSAPSAILTAATMPSAPTGLALAAVSGGQINLSWTDHSTAAAYYYVGQSTNGTSWSQIASLSGATTASYTATGPFSGSTTYYFRVNAYAYTGGNSAYATNSVTTAAFPNQPSLTSATAQSATTVALVWGNVTGATGFTVQRSTNSGSTWTTAGTVGTGVTTFTDTGLSEATSYAYSVIATNAAGSSAQSAMLSVVTQPGAPSGLAATTVSAVQINLTWTDHSAAASYYYVEQSPDNTTWTVLASIYGSTTNSYTATGPFNGSTTYYFRVRAYSYSGGYSAYAPVASTTTPAFPNQPTISAATAQSDTAVLLSWTNISGATGYQVQRSVSGTWTTEGTVGSGVTSYTDTGLHEVTSYSYRLIATNAAGSSAPSATVSATTLPAAPTGLAATGVAWNQVNLTWVDHSSAAYYYYVEQSPDNTNWTQIASIYSSTATSYTATGPFNGSTTYYFRVRDYGGTYSTYTPVASTTMPAFPNQPTISAATPQSDTAVLLTWTNVSGATGYQVQRSVSGTWTTEGTVGSGVTSYTDTGLHEVTSYSYRLIATNAVGSSAPSATVSATTLPAAPTGLAAAFVAWNQINLTWVDHSSAAYYYYVEQSPDNTNWTQIASVYGTTTTSYSATGPFTGSTSYYFRVRDYSGTYSTYTTTSLVTPAFPTAPTLTQATAISDTSVTLAWQDVPLETGFQVSRLVSSTWTLVGTVGAGVKTFTDTGLHEATSYSYHVAATNSAGSSPPSGTLSATTFTSAPTGLTATAVSGSLINLSWTDVSTSASTNYVEESTDGVTWAQIGSVAATATTFAATGAFTRLTTYSFRVRAYGYTGGGYSSYATTSVTTPAFAYTPAINWVVPQSSSSVALSWTNAPGETGFRVQRSTNNGSTWSVAGTVASGVTTFTDTGLTEATSYTYEIIATNSYGDSIPSATQAAVTPPGAPTGLTAVAASAGQINLSWTDHSTAAAYYVVQQSSNGSTGWVPVGTVNGSSANSDAVTGSFSGSTTYYFRVAAYASTGGTSAYATASATVPAVPGTPALNSATAQSDTAVSLVWSDAPGETGFTVERSTGTSGTWSVAGTVGAGVTTFTNTSLTEATSYNYYVVATNAAGSSAPSNTIGVNTQPSAPTGLTTTVVSGGQINLAWTDHSTAAISYYVELATDGTTWAQIAAISSSTATSYTATGPFNGSTTYYFRVHDYAPNGVNSAYASASATTPAFTNQPTLTSATAQSASSVALAWSAVTGATGYTVQRSTNGGTTWTTAGTVGSGVTSFTDTGLTEATSYSYEVIATDAAGSSAPSAMQSVTTQPGAPTGLTATVVSGGQINLAWTDHSSAANYYYVEQSPNGTTWAQIAAISGSTTNSYAAIGPFNGSTTYQFRVHAYAYTGGNSAYATASATTPAFPNQPTLTSVTAQSASSMALAWSAVTGATGYTIQRSTNSGSSWTNAGTVGAGVTTFTDTGLTEATSYSYQVIATDAAGSSAPSAMQTVATQPGAPTSLTATVVSGGQINLAWSDHSTAAYYYYVEQSPNGTTWAQIAALNGNTTNSYTATGPFNGSTTYQFRVHSYAYPGGNSTYATASATTPAFPNQPTLTSVTVQSASSVALAWSTVTSATGYTIQRSTNSGSSWTTAGTVGSGTTSYTDTGLTEATSYSYHVIATDAAGSSAPSAMQTVATGPGAPTGLTATVLSGGQINLSWTDHSTAAIYYYVEQSPNGTTWAQIAAIYSSTATSYTATGPFNGSTTYQFRVHAYAYTGGNSAYVTGSATTPAFPNQPTLTSVTAQSASSVALAWSAVTGATGYTLQRSINGGTSWTTAGTVGSGTTTFTDTGLTEATSYSYQVIATDAAGSSAPSAMQTVVTQPGAPTGLTATAVSAVQINLTWTDHSTAANYYYIEQSPNNTTWAQIGSVYGSGANSFTATGPFNGSTIYYFRVRAYAYTGGYSAYAPAVSTTTGAFPNQPTLTATAQSDTAIALTWTGVTTATGYRVERYVSSNGTWTAIGIVASGVTSFTDTGLREGSSFTYRLFATDATGDSAPSASASATTLTAAPTGLTASAIAGNLINLAWTDHSSSASSYSVEQSSDGVNWAQIAAIYDLGAINFSATGPFLPSTTYYFRVHAYSMSGGNSTYATATSATPAYPSQPVLTSAATQSDTSVLLTWSNPTGETGFLVQRLVGTTWTTVGTVGSGVTTFTDTGLHEASSYSYQVIATNSAGHSAPSGTLGATTQPSAPTGLTVTVVSGGQINLSWTDHSSAATYYYLDQSTNGTTWAQIAAFPGSPTSYPATGPFKGSATYYFRLHAYAYTGGNSAYATVSATTPAFPNQPALTSATAQSATSVALAWSAMTGATGYTVQRSSNGGTTWTTAGTVGSGVTSFTDTGLTEATTYKYRLIATNAAGSSAPSAVQTVATQPAAPTGLAATAVSAVQINLTWTDHSAVASGYYIEQSTDNSTWTVIGVATGTTAASYTATGPFNGSTTYYFRVRGYGGVGGYSTYAPTATTTTAAFPNQPTLTATPQSSTAIALLWNIPARATGFLAQRLVGATWTTMATLGSGVTTYTDTGLTEATSYSYQVIATDSTGNSAPSVVQVAATQPAAPTGLTATAVSAVQINLSWTDHSTAAYYNYVEQSTDNATWTVVGSVYGTTAASYTATGPFNGSTTYYFRVRGFSNVGGYSAYAPTATTTTAAFPNQPTLTATPQSPTSIALSWSNPARATGFLAQRMVAGVWTTVATLGSGVTTYTDTGLTEASSYSYQVIATDSTGPSAPSVPQTVATPPAPPTGLTLAFVSAVQINLSWTDLSTAAYYYYVEQSTDNATWTVVGSVYGTTATSYTATGPFNGSTTYYFRVRDSGGLGGLSTYAAVASMSTAAYPNQPTLTAIPQSDTSVALSWSNPARATGFLVQRLVSGAWTTFATLGSGVTAYTDTGLHEATSYSYQVIATDSTGNSAPSATQVASTLLDAPLSVTATFVSGTRINLSWTDRSTMATAYFVQQSPDGVTWAQIGSLGSTATSFTATGPFDPSTSYRFRVQAYTSLETANSPTAVVTTPAAPLIPTGVTAVPTSDTSVTVTWTAMTYADGYKVERSTDGAITWAPIVTLGANQTTYIDTGLTEGESLYYRVRATDALFSFVSYGSNVAAATTLPKAPTGLAVTSIDGGQVQLQWQNHSAIAAGYLIEELIGGTYQQIQTTAPGATTATVAGVFAASTSYSFKVQAFEPVLHSANQGSLPSNVAQVTTGAWPVVPANLVATAVSKTEIDLSWTDNAGTGANYQVERSPDGSTWTQIATVAAGSSGTAQYANTGLTGGELANYDYEVRATKAGVGDSAYSSIAYATTLLATPTGLTATISNGGAAVLSWVGNSAPATDYIVNELVNGQWQELQVTLGVVQSVTVYGAFAPSTTYQFQVVADMETATGDSAGSAPSNTATATTAAWPAAPTNLTTTAVSGTAVDLTWTDNATNATSYKVERTTDGVNWTVLTSTLPSTATSYHDTGLSVGTMYGYRVSALNGVGGSGYAMGTAATLPTAPTNFQGTVVSSSEIDLSWTASTYATGYTISIEEDGSTTWTELGTVPASQTTYAATGLEPGTDYSFCVAPTNSTAPTAVAYLDPETIDTQPTITNISGADDPVTGTTVTLTANATGGTGALIYYWSSPATAVSFGNNNTASALSTTVTFYQAGYYWINLWAVDSAGNDSNVFVKTVIVNQTLTGIVVTSTNSTAILGQVTQTASGLQIAPGNGGVLVGQTQQFYATAVDQFGNPMQEQPPFTWSAAGAAGGTVSGGLYTAPTTLDQDSTDTVTASSGGKTGTANVAVLTANIKVNMIQDQQPISIDEIDLSQYKNITQIVVTSADPAGLHYDDISYDDENGAQFISFLELPVGTVVTNQFPGVTFNGGTVSPDYEFTNVYMPPGGWGGAMVVKFASPVNKLMFSTGWVDTQVGGVYGQVAITTARLFSLTVNDDSNPNNSVTAIQNQPQQLYVPVNPLDDYGAFIDINALPGAGGDQNVHIRVMIGDPNGVVADEEETSLENLFLPAQGNYVIAAWVDNNDDGEVDPSEDELIVNVSVVLPWSSVGNWTSNVANFVVANAPGVSLQDLAQAITGDPTDASLFGNIGPILKGEQVDVSPLLTKLQQTVNNNIVEATQDPDIWYSCVFPTTDHTPEAWSLSTIGEAQLNSLFGDGWTGPEIPYSCIQMAEIFVTRGIQGVLQPGEFDQIGQNVNTFFLGYTQVLTGTPLALLQPGNVARFYNAPEIPNEASWWSVENTIVLGGGEYFGWPLGVETEPELKEILMNAYNAGVDKFNKQLSGLDWLVGGKWPVGLQQVLGYVPSKDENARAVNTPRLAQAIFNLRTSNQ